MNDINKTLDFDSIDEKYFNFYPNSNFPWHKFMSPENKNI